MSKVDALFSPFQYGPLSLPNRIVMAPMTRRMSPDHIPNDAVAEYYRRRAAGGVGLIVTEGTCIDHSAANAMPGVPYFYGDDALAGWKKVVQAVHGEGGKIMPQLWHVGGVRKAGVVGPDKDVPGHSPSGKASPNKVTGHAMTQADINETVAAYAKGARDAKALGFDGIELHGAHGYLIDQFFWEGTNDRTDAYGGDMQARSRFAIEVIEAVRDAVGPDFPVVFRWSQWKQQDYDAKLANTPAELEAFLLPLSDAGVDIFHCSTRRFWENEFEGDSMNLAGWTKKITGKPSITVGSVGLSTDFLPAPGTQDFKDAQSESVDELAQRVEDGEFDLVAVGRALIANADWPERVRHGDSANISGYNAEMLTTLA